MAKAPTEKVYKDLAEVEPVIKYEKENSTSFFRFRLIEAATEPFIRFDIRECIKTKNYEGYTARGCTFSLAQIPDVIDRLQKLQAKFNEMYPKKEKASKKTK